MDRIEWNQSLDSLSDGYAESDQVEIALERSSPFLDQFARSVEAPKNLRDAESVMSRVIEEAENNHTAERILERKHEVKDLAGTKTHQIQYAARLGELLESKRQTFSGMSDVQPLLTNKQNPVSLRSLIHSNSLYGYAIRYGFISALLALLTAILVVTLFT